jgi:hypothetical protein
MRNPIQAALTYLRTARENFFLKKHSPSVHTLQMLHALYPSVNWSRVDFYEGLPWFTPGVAPYVTAQALPDFYSCTRFRIYLKKFDESRVQCLADVVHEAFHILQAMHFSKGYGVGFFRIWMFYYIACFIKQGYRNNDFEIPAYEQEFRFLHFCAKQGLHGITPKADERALNRVSMQPELIFSDIRYRYKGSAWALAGSLIFCLLVTLVKPLADVIVFLLGSLIGRKEAGVIHIKRKPGAIKNT